LYLANYSSKFVWYNNTIIYSEDKKGVFYLKKDSRKENIKNNTSIDPLIVVAAHKGYEWMVSDKSMENEANEFEVYILNSTTKEEIIDFREKKSLRDFITWKYVNFLTRAEGKE
jgi:hypothetical protein